MEKQSIISISIPIEYQAFLEDSLRMIVIQISTNYLLNKSDNKRFKFISIDNIYNYDTPELN